MDHPNGQCMCFGLGVAFCKKFQKKFQNFQKFGNKNVLFPRTENISAEYTSKNKKLKKNLSKILFRSPCKHFYDQC